AAWPIWTLAAPALPPTWARRVAVPALPPGKRTARASPPTSWSVTSRATRPALAADELQRHLAHAAAERTELAEGGRQHDRRQVRRRLAIVGAAHPYRDVARLAAADRELARAGGHRDGVGDGRRRRHGSRGD